MLAVDRLVAEDEALQAFAVYAVVTGLGSMALAFDNRDAARLGPWAWTIMLAWAGHLWAIVWLVNIEVVGLPETWRSPAVVVALAALFFAAEALGIGALRRRLQRRD